MNNYYMNDNTHNFQPIVGVNNQASMVQDLIDAYLFGGGEVTYCEEGARSTDDEVRTYDTTSDEHSGANLMRGYSLFDQIQLNKGKEYNQKVEDLFENPEKF